MRYAEETNHLPIAITLALSDRGLSLTSASGRSIPLGFYKDNVCSTNIKYLGFVQTHVFSAQEICQLTDRCKLNYFLSCNSCTKRVILKIDIDGAKTSPSIGVGTIWTSAICLEPSKWFLIDMMDTSLTKGIDLSLNTGESSANYNRMIRDCVRLSLFEPIEVEPSYFFMMNTKAYMLTPQDDMHVYSGWDLVLS